MKTKIINYAGMNKSMGAVFAIINGNDRVIMDFGSGFEPNLPTYVKKDDNWIIDKLNLGLLPKIEGLYPKQYLKDYPLLSYEDSHYKTAIFISHLHLDHMSNIGAVHPNVNVYLSKDAVRLEEALEDINEGVDSIKRSYSCLDKREFYKIGNIKVYPLLNSPYSYQMYAYYIETDDLHAAYLADFSLTNEQPLLLYQELDFLKEKKVDLLYCDVCNFDDESLLRLYHSLDPKKILPSKDLPKGMISNHEHYQKLKNEYLNCHHLIIFNHYEREMFNVEQLIYLSKLMKRELVFEPKAAYLVYKFFDIKVNYYLNEENYTDDWFKILKEKGNRIKKEDILNNPSHYLLHNSFKNLNELEAFKGLEVDYFHAEGDPFNIKDLNYLKNRINELGFNFHSYEDENYFQHAYPNHMKYFVDELNPYVIIGYHGFHPERILAKDGYNLIPKLYQEYIFEDKRLKELE